MTISFTSNRAADYARLNLETATTNAQRSMTKVSSGIRVFSAAEDSAALSISTGLSADESALRAADLNTRGASSMLQIADGALSQMSDIINRMDALATQAASGQLSSVERGYLDGEFGQLRDELNRIGEISNFNGVPLLGGRTEVEVGTIGTSVDSDNGYVGFQFADFVDPAHTFEFQFIESTDVLTVTNATTGAAQTINVQRPDPGHLNEYTFNDIGLTLTLNSSFDDTTDLLHTGAAEEVTAQVGATAVGASFEFQVGRTTTTNDRITVDMPIVNSDSLGLSVLSLSTEVGAKNAIDALRLATSTISSERASIGAYMNRMEVASSSIQVSLENVVSSNSALIDVDVAAEITELTSQQVLIQSATNMVSRANQNPERLLELLR